MKAVVSVCMIVLALVACGDDAPRIEARLQVGDLLSAPADPRFERALEVREFTFPNDHGPHGTFQTEWWYFTGNLSDDAGAEYGYQLTFFRRALAADAPTTTSAWSTRDVYMAHFTVASGPSELTPRGDFRAFERFERGALGLAGAQSEPWRVWTRDWSAAGDLDDGEVRLVARDGDVELDLTLIRSSAIVLQGDRGLSRKGQGVGNASYYYSIPRLATSGTLRRGATTMKVRGESWFDREWSTSALEAGQVGWDWFALRFDDGSTLMLYSMRRADGTRDPASAATFSEVDGRTHSLDATQFEIVETERWTSATSGATYPSAWTLRVPKFALECDVTPLVPDSELRLAVRYWEGAVLARSRRDGREVAGRGFVELTGY